MIFLSQLRSNENGRYAENEGVWQETAVVCVKVGVACKCFSYYGGWGQETKA